MTKLKKHSIINANKKILSSFGKIHTNQVTSSVPEQQDEFSHTTSANLWRVSSVNKMCKWKKRLRCWKSVLLFTPDKSEQLLSWTAGRITTVFFGSSVNLSTNDPLEQNNILNGKLTLAFI